jgi:hypothetical protein
MKDIFSFVVLLRLFYSSFLLFIALVLMREVWFVWFDRQMTFGEIKYFDGVDVKQGAADRFRYLLNQEYNRALDDIRQYRQILETISGRPIGEKPDLLHLEGSVDPTVLTRATGFESFEPKQGDFAQLDLSFQGIDVKKLFSSVRSYLSPSVDLNLLVTKYGADDMRANIRWPREGRPLEGELRRYYDFEIGPHHDDAVLSRKVACYLLWLQAFNGQPKEFAAFDEFCLWIDGLTALRAIADEKKHLAVNSGLEAAAVSKIAARFTPSLSAGFDYVDNYRVAAILVTESARRDSQYAPQVSAGSGKIPVGPTFLASLLNYYYLHLVSNPGRLAFFKEVSANFSQGNPTITDPVAVGLKLLANRVVPWSDIVHLIQDDASIGSNSNSTTPGPASLERIILAGRERFASADIGQFGFPKRELSSILRNIGPDGQWLGTAFLVAPDVALTTGFNHQEQTDESAKALGFVDYVASPYEPSGVKFHRIAVKEVVPLITSEPVGVLALKLETPIAAATPFKMASRYRKDSRTGRPIYLLSYLSNVPLWNENPLNKVFNNEFERPVYLGGTILLQNETEKEIQYAYDAFTLPGAGGSPVLDAATGEVIAMHHSGSFYSSFAKIAVGLDITSLSDNAELKALIAK